MFGRSEIQVYLTHRWVRWLPSKVLVGSALVNGTFSSHFEFYLWSIYPFILPLTFPISSWLSHTIWHCLHFLIAHIIQYCALTCYPTLYAINDFVSIFFKVNTSIVHYESKYFIPCPISVLIFFLCLLPWPFINIFHSLFLSGYSPCFFILPLVPSWKPHSPTLNWDDWSQICFATHVWHSLWNFFSSIIQCTFILCPFAFLYCDIIYTLFSSSSLFLNSFLYISMYSIQTIFPYLILQLSQSLAYVPYDALSYKVYIMSGCHICFSAQTVHDKCSFKWYFSELYMLLFMTISFSEGGGN